MIREECDKINIYKVWISFLYESKNGHLRGIFCIKTLVLQEN